MTHFSVLFCMGASPRDGRDMERHCKSRINNDGCTDIVRRAEWSFLNSGRAGRNGL